jgi:hypothetical protein
MNYLTLKNEMTTILESYHGYDPQQSKAKNALALFKGHGKEGYERLLTFQEIIKISPEDDFIALRHNLAKECIKYYKDPQSRSKNSSLLEKISKLLKKAYEISDSEVQHLSPNVYIGPDGGSYSDTQIGLLKAIENKVAAEQGASQIMQSGRHITTGTAPNLF